MTLTFIVLYSGHCNTPGLYLPRLSSPLRKHITPAGQLAFLSTLSCKYIQASTHAPTCAESADRWLLASKQSEHKCPARTAVPFVLSRPGGPHIQDSLCREPRKTPWVLEDSPGHATHIGLPEGGISGSGVSGIPTHSLMPFLAPLG